MSLQPAILAQMSEQDEAGKVVRTYVLSSSSSASSDKKAGKYGGEKRVDVIVSNFSFFFFFFTGLCFECGGVTLFLSFS